MTVCAVTSCVRRVGDALHNFSVFPKETGTKAKVSSRKCNSEEMHAARNLAMTRLRVTSIPQTQIERIDTFHEDLLAAVRIRQLFKESNCSQKLLPLTFNL